VRSDYIASSLDGTRSLDVGLLGTNDPSYEFACSEMQSRRAGIMPACTANNHKVVSTGSPPGGLDSEPRFMGSLSASLPGCDQELLRDQDSADHGARFQDDTRRASRAEEGRQGPHHKSSEIDQERHCSFSRMDENEKDKARHQPCTCHSSQLLELSQRVPAVREQWSD